MSVWSKTLFIPSLYGQYKVFKKDIEKVIEEVQEIIQMGNIIGCNEYAADKGETGPNNAILKFLFSEHAYTDKWTQLIGTNEIAALNFPKEWTNDETNHLLRRAWIGEKEIFKVATVSKNRLVTHGGLTYGKWVELGEPETAEKAADLINEEYRHTLYQGTSYILGDAPNYSANPIWAHPFMELYPSWITAPTHCPFDQIHASNSLNSVEGRAAMNNDFSATKYVDRVRYNESGSIATIKNSKIIGLTLDLNKNIIPSLSGDWRMLLEKEKVR